MAEIGKDLVHGFIILVGLLVLLAGACCVGAAWSDTHSEGPRSMRIIGWILTGIMACLITGMVFRK